MRHPITTAAAAVAVWLLLVMLAATGATAADSNKPQPKTQTQAQPIIAESPTSISRSSKTASSSRVPDAARTTKPVGSKLDSNSLSQLPPARVQAVTCPTGANMVTLSPGVDLATAASAPGKTYKLQAGDYWINSTIRLDGASQVICYQGEATAARDAVRILVDPSVSDSATGGYALDVRDGAALGLINLSLDGQGSAGGVVVDGAALVIVDTRMQRFNIAISNFFGAAVRLFGGATASILGSTFTDNVARAGGAVLAASSTLTLRQVTFERNSAAQGIGGAMYVLQSMVTIEGQNTIKANSAALLGGGIEITSSSVVVSGQLCASSNTAGLRGGFAYVDRGTLVFNEGSDVSFGFNTPTTMAVFRSEQPEPDVGIKCGADSPTWAAAATAEVTFNITGPACACNQTFVSSTLPAQTCDGCNGIPWDPVRCACGGCDSPGEGCCRPDGTISPAGTVCRRSAGLCDVEERCTADGVCPEDSFVVAGTLCRSPRGACERPSVCSGKGPSCAKNYAINGKPCAFFKSDVKDVFWPTEIQSAPARVADDQAHAPNLDGENAYTMRYRYGRETDDDLRRNSAGDTTGYYDRHSFGDSGDHTYKQHDSNWPECFGSCFAGKCTLEQERPGCCYPGSHGLYAASQQTDAVVAASDTYKQQGPGQDLVCWRGAHDIPQIVQGKA